MPRPHHRKDGRGMNRNLNNDSDMNHKRGYRSVYGSTQFRPTPLVSLLGVLGFRMPVVPAVRHAAGRNAVSATPVSDRLLNRSTGLARFRRVCVGGETGFGGVR
jgi:hypothetical protein